MFDSLTEVMKQCQGTNIKQAPLLTRFFFFFFSFTVQNLCHDIYSLTENPLLWPSSPMSWGQFQLSCKEANKPHPTAASSCTSIPSVYRSTWVQRGSSFCIWALWRKGGGYNEKGALCSLSLPCPSAFRSGKQWTHTQVSVGLHSSDGSRSVRRLEFVTKSVERHIGAEIYEKDARVFFNCNFWETGVFKFTAEHNFATWLNYLLHQCGPLICICTTLTWGIVPRLANLLARLDNRLLVVVSLLGS